MPSFGVSSVGSALASFMGLTGARRFDPGHGRLNFRDIVATGFTQTITKGTWLEEIDYVND